MMSSFLLQFLSSLEKLKISRNISQKSERRLRAMFSMLRERDLIQVLPMLLR